MQILILIPFWWDLLWPLVFSDFPTCFPSLTQIRLVRGEFVDESSCPVPDWIGLIRAARNSQEQNLEAVSDLPGGQVNFHVTTSHFSRCFSVFWIENPPTHAIVFKINKKMLWFFLIITFLDFLPSSERNPSRRGAQCVVLQRACPMVWHPHHGNSHARWER